MPQKTVKYNQNGISGLPKDKPVVYEILTKSGKRNHIGSSKRGRVEERIKEHLDAGKIPGAKVRIKQKQTIQEAKKAEKRAIALAKPKYNKQS